MWPSKRNAPAHRNPPRPSAPMNFHHGIFDNPAIGGATVLSPGTNFAITSAHPPSRLNQCRVEETQESGSSEMRHRSFRTDEPFRRPMPYHTPSANIHAATDKAKASVQLYLPVPMSAPIASRIGPDGRGAP